MIYTVYATTRWHVWLYCGHNKIFMPQPAQRLAPGDSVEIAIAKVTT